MLMTCRQSGFKNSPKREIPAFNPRPATSPLSLSSSTYKTVHTHDVRSKRSLLMHSLALATSQCLITHILIVRPLRHHPFPEVPHIPFGCLGRYSSSWSRITSSYTSSIFTVSVFHLALRRHCLLPERYRSIMGTNVVATIPWRRVGTIRPSNISSQGTLVNIHRRHLVRAIPIRFG